MSRPDNVNIRRL